MAGVFELVTDAGMPAILPVRGAGARITPVRRADFSGQVRNRLSPLPAATVGRQPAEALAASVLDDVELPESAALGDGVGDGVAGDEAGALERDAPVLGPDPLEEVVPDGPAADAAELGKDEAAGTDGVEVDDAVAVAVGERPKATRGDVRRGRRRRPTTDPLAVLAPTTGARVG